ncbi:MAG: VTT domain-containing protein [Bdellovibrionales bacterium]|nr:VTT domain-containing protein [Bdellovibrionales bacterium]
MIRQLTERNEEWEKLKKSNFSYAMLSLASFFVIAGALSLFFEENLKFITNWVVQNFGFQGMCTFIFVADAIVSPLPPDAMLFVIAKSDMHTNWLPYVFTLSLFSVLAGKMGYLIGYSLQRFSFIHPKIVDYYSKKRSLVEKYGHWVVVLGALTPLPFSLSCWAAGMVRLKWRNFFLASLFRIPRIFVAYFMIYNSKFLTEFLSSWN